MSDWFNDEWDDFDKPKIVYREIRMQMDACEVPFWLIEIVCLRYQYGANLKSHLKFALRMWYYVACFDFKRSFPP